jgi:hypothetical protein
VSESTKSTLTWDARMTLESQTRDSRHMDTTRREMKCGIRKHVRGVGSRLTRGKSTIMHGSRIYGDFPITQSSQATWVDHPFIARGLYKVTTPRCSVDPTSRKACIKTSTTRSSQKEKVEVMNTQKRSLNDQEGALENGLAGY